MEKIVGNDHELGKVLRDGACGMSCFALHAHGDASLGPDIGK